MELFEFTYCQVGKKRLEVLQRLQGYEIPVVIYGTGRFAREVAEFLQENDVQIKCFVDKNIYWYEGKTVSIAGRTYPCQNVDIRFSVPGDYVVIYGFIDATEFEESKELFVGYKDFVYIDGCRWHWMSDDFLQVNKNRLEDLYDLLQDEESRHVMKAYLYARYTGDIWPLGGLRQTCSYDWELLDIGKDDVFLDGGAYVGDTILELIKYQGGDILAFEPDKQNLIRLLENCSVDILARLHVYPYALWSKDTVLYFNETGTVGSAVSDKGDVEIKALALDAHECFGNVSVIKMDVEGGELEALYGMCNLIKKNKPRLAICIYHKIEDILEIPSFLANFGYKFYLRQHAFSAEETVLYAI